MLLRLDKGCRSWVDQVLYTHLHARVMAFQVDDPLS